jgi:hypothetical protein
MRRLRSSRPAWGAEADAIAIYDALIKPEIGDYDPDRSRLLRSPTLQDVRNTLTETLFGDGHLDALTIVFAGHGGVSGGSFYMAVRESRSDALSATALSLADLLRMVAEAAPKQTYLFIDACQAGGLISDLNVILKSEVMGKFGTPGVTLLATAASNQSALETGGHGIGTAALLDCIHGRTFLQDSNPALDLVEVGRAVSERVAAAGAQTPVVWGLNLYGPSSFCRNPHMSSGNAPLRSVLFGWPDEGAATAIRSGLPRLWEPYIGITTRWDPRALIDRLAPLLAELKDNPTILVDFSRRITEACVDQARETKDLFREIEVRAACVVALLPFSDDAEVSAYSLICCEQIGLLVEGAINAVTAGVGAYRYAIVTGGRWDLYHLPIRLSKLLGWAGFASHVRIGAGGKRRPVEDMMSNLFAWVLENYSLSLVSMSDCQAPYVLTAATAAAELGLNEQGESLLSHLFLSTVECGGKIARADLDPDEALNHLIWRHQGGSQSAKLFAQPTELVTAVLRAARLFDLVDAFDTSLNMIDHLKINAYLPADYREFGVEHIPNGFNVLYQISHVIWSVADLERSWPNFPSPKHASTRLASLLASLLFPDRTPWFLLPVPSLIEATDAQVREDDRGVV